VFLELPGTGAHLEFTSGGDHCAAEPHPESLLVLYLADETSLAELAERIGQAPVKPANPDWEQRALTFVDPDGYHVILVGAQDHP
jgi:hypothetical protein